jgi:hypothetical protein
MWSFWSFAAQPGLATAILDFTDALAWFGVGLLGLTALAGWWTAREAVRHQVSQRATHAAQTAPASYREAAERSAAVAPCTWVHV